MNRLNASHAAAREVGAPAPTQLAACRGGPLSKPASIRLASREVPPYSKKSSALLMETASLDDL